MSFHWINHYVFNACNDWINYEPQSLTSSRFVFIWLLVVCRHYHESDYFLFPLYARTFKYVRLLYNQVRTNQVRVNYPASCIPHLQLESPALNQAHPVSLCIKSQCAQSCLLDCTGWFSQSLKRFLSSQNPQSCCSLRVLFVYFCSLLPVPSPLVFSRPGPVYDLPLDHDYASSLTSLYFGPVTPVTDPRLPYGPALGSPLIILFTGSRPWTVVLLSWFILNHCFLPELGLAIGFLFISPDSHDLD